MRPLLLVLLLSACDGEPPPAAPQPGPKPAAAPEPPSEADGITAFLASACPGFEGSAGAAQIVPEPFGDHGKGRTVHFGTDALWFVAPDGNVFTDSASAAATCPGLPTVRDYDRARARSAAKKAHENDPTACSMADLRIADAVADHMEVNLFGPARDLGKTPKAEHVANIEDDGLDRVAAEMSIPRAKVEAVWAKVRKVCPKAL